MAQVKTDAYHFDRLAFCHFIFVYRLSQSQILIHQIIKK